MCKGQSAEARRKLEQVIEVRSAMVDGAPYGGADQLIELYHSLEISGRVWPYRTRR